MGKMAETTSFVSIADEYFRALENHDLQAVAGLLQPNLHFKGPLGERDGRDQFVSGLERLLPMWRLQKINVRGRFQSGNQVVLIYDFVCAEPLGMCRIAEFLSFEGEKIKDIELFLDPRPFEKLTAGQNKSVA
jgi:SnoaL-like protein